MSVFLQPIYTQTVGTGSPTTINFNSIPQTFTDLMIYATLRVGNVTGNPGGAEVRWTLNGDTATNYSNTRISARNVTVTPTIASNEISGRFARTATVTQTANSFSNHSIYIPNYTSSNFKSYIVDGVIESNDTNNNLEMFAGLWRNTAAITSLSIFGVASFDQFAQYATVSLYGITKG